MVARLLLLSFALACACGDSSPAATPDALDANVLRVNGQYSTSVSLTQSTCQGIQVQDNPTNLAHVPGASALTLTHAGVNYPGTVARDGSFTTTAVPVTVGSDTHTLTIAGRFSATGFDATVSAAVSRSGGTVCDYVVHWSGTKLDGMNVIPD
jgi:hypothetical protein